jgi:acyl-CoA synthetase (AMP-forming)/AMP-acid ligase II
MNIALLLEMAAQAEPDRIALVCDGQRWTYGELDQAARGACDVIRASEASTVALLDQSSAASVIALFGAALAGVPYCPINYRLADADLATLLARIAPALVVGDLAWIERIGAAPGHRLFDRAGFIRAAQDSAALADGAADDGTGVAIQLFTSGTTSAPKAAILAHSNLVSYILGTVEFGSADPAEATLVSVPPYHIAGIAAMISSIYAQRRIVLLPAFAPEAWLRLIETEQVTNAFVVPTMLGRVIEAMEQGARADISSLRAIAYGGGKMPLELIRKALDCFPETAFTNAYGLTETSSTIALLGPEEHRRAHRSDDPGEKARLASVGIPLPTVELEVRDDSGRVLPAGEIGEIYVRGDQVSGQYREKNALDSAGWFPTRDAGYLDEEGYLFLTGRADDVIVRGGENISPGEIEDVLLAHPAIGDVAAVAVPSLEWGEAVGIAVVLRESHDAPSTVELQHMVRARLRSSRVPEVIRFLPSLPYNEMGKLLRREVKKLLAC